ILLVTLNRPRDLNCINMDGHIELDAVWRWLDEEPSLSVGILTGEGRAFSAGADLKGRTPSDLPSFAVTLTDSQNSTTKTSRANHASCLPPASVGSRAA